MNRTARFMVQQGNLLLRYLELEEAAVIEKDVRHARNLA